MRADGDNSLIEVKGYPLNFSGSDATIRARGATNHSIFIGYSGGFTNTSCLSINNTGNFVVDANGKAGNGGPVQISVDQSSITATTFTVTANGPESGNADSGTVADTWMLSGGLVVMSDKPDYEIDHRFSDLLELRRPDGTIFQATSDVFS